MQRASSDRMQRTSLAVGSLTLAVSLALAGCGAIHFGIGYDIPEQLVMGSSDGGALDGELVPVPLDIDLSAETAARGTGPAQHIYLTSFTLSVTATSEPPGDTDDLGFVDHVELFASGASQGSNLPRVRIAHLDQVPDGARTITLESDGVDLIAYVQQGARLDAIASGFVPPDDVSVSGHVDFNVVVL
jgi:hypothetical protein